MAKKIKKQEALTFKDIVLNGQADIIKQAYEARVKIDALLEKREEAYRQISSLESQVDEVLGEDGIFNFPSPVCQIAGVVKPKVVAKKTITKPADSAVQEENVDNKVADSATDAPQQ